MEVRCHINKNTVMQEVQRYIMWGRTATEGVFWRVHQVCVTTFYCEVCSSFWGSLCQTLTWQDSVSPCWVRDSVVCYLLMHSRTPSFYHTCGGWVGGNSGTNWSWQHLHRYSYIALKHRFPNFWVNIPYYGIHCNPLHKPTSQNTIVRNINAKIWPHTSHMHVAASSSWKSWSS